MYVITVQNRRYEGALTEAEYQALIGSRMTRLPSGWQAHKLTGNDDAICNLPVFARDLAADLEALLTVNHSPDAAQTLKSAWQNRYGDTPVRFRQIQFASIQSWAAHDRLVKMGILFLINPEQSQKSRRLTTRRSMDKIAIVYVGRRVVARNLCYVYVQIQEVAPQEQPLDETITLNFKKPLVPLARAAPGSIWQVHATINTTTGGMSVHTDKSGQYKPLYLGMWKHTAQRKKWLIADEAIETELAADRRASKDRDIDSDALFRALEPFRAEYRNANTVARRRAILALVIQYISD
jgi:hypothetical protein